MSIGFDRRRFLGTAGALSLTLLSKQLRAYATPAAPVAPVARIDVVRDTYFGETLSDPYRWMENANDPDWLPFLRGQNAHTHAILDALPMRASLLRRIQELSSNTVATGRVQRAGGLTFFIQRPQGADNFKLFVRKGGRDRVLIDPTKAGDTTGHTSLDWWRAAPDGRHVVYGLSKNGSEDSTLRVLAVADGRDLAERIGNAQQANPAWLDDGSGFFYNQLTAAVATPERFLDSQARLHRLGTDPNSDPVLMKRGLVPGVEYERIQAPYIVTYPGARHAILLLSDVRPEGRAFIAPLADVLAGRPRWTPFAAFEDEVTDFELEGEDLYLLVNHGTARGRIVKTSAASPNIATAAVVVPQGPYVIQDISRARDGLYLRLMDGGLSRLQRLEHGGRITDIALPFEGSLGSVYTAADEDGALLSLTGWLEPAAIYSVSTEGRVADTGITPKPPIDVAPYVARRFFATAKDGTKIPYSVVHRKDLTLDGSAPAWITAYGSYGLSPNTPAFVGRALALIDAGAVVGYANVRGGGEYGREWHKAGQLANKPNTWRDLIAVCEDLVAKKYTSPSHLAIGGRSAGGITVGRAMTERPELFAAVVDGVGWSNPLRYVVEQDSYTEEPEWGAISNAEGYRFLKLIDSYQSVKDGTRYPAVLLTTGVTDPRVAPFHVAKMTARLQAASSSGKPILLRVDFDAGHGIGSTRSQQDREVADTHAFLLWQLRG
ncbi:MAG TPA: prolyl oligopeptidase family serine peptidase [Steroidobacteraceae bacterium]